MDIISGEKIQLLAQLYIGSDIDFKSNPFIFYNSDIKPIVDLRRVAHQKQRLNNPKIVYCHGHYIPVFSMYSDLLDNPFILITHNSDYNIIDNSITQTILACPKLIKWYGQNIGYKHNSLSFIPIGIANRMWSHGRLFLDNLKDVLTTKKTEMVYMNFSIDTNFEKRNDCYHTLVSKNVTFLPTVSSIDNIERMKSYKFCICPEGNGFDTHRLWEALYLRCVPIVLKSTFSEIVRNTTGLPMILLNSWEEFDITALPDYNNFDFETSNHGSIDCYKKKILSIGIKIKL
jgi:hypothetical protein